MKVKYLCGAAVLAMALATGCESDDVSIPSSTAIDTRDAALGRTGRGRVADRPRSGRVTMESGVPGGQLLPGVLDSTLI